MEMLIKVINTLNSIEVKGEENMSKLLGSICVLKEISKSLEEESEKEEE